MTWTWDTGHGTAETAYTANGAGHSELGHEQAASRNRLNSSLPSPSLPAWLKVKTEKGLHFLPKCNGYGERSRRKQKGRREKRDREGRGNGVRQATTVQLPHTHPLCGPDVPHRIVKLCGSFDNFVSTRSSSPPAAPPPLLLVLLLHLLLCLILRCPCPCSTLRPVAFCSEIISDPISCRVVDSNGEVNVGAATACFAWLSCRKNACNLLGLTWVATTRQLAPRGVGVFCGMQRKWFSFLYNCCQRDLPQLQ